jgi:hypothetical protein
MKKLQKLGTAAVLTFVLALSVFAGQGNTLPCADPVPGQIDTPPCPSASGDLNSLGVTSTTPADTAVANGDTSFTEIATDVVLNILSLY